MVLATLVFLALAAPASAEFSIAEFDATTTSSQAGGHPDVTASLSFATIEEAGGKVFADGSVRSLAVQLPPGLVGAAGVTSRCSQLEFTERECQPETQVGWVEIGVSSQAGDPSRIELPVFNLQPGSEDVTAEVAFAAGVLGAAHLPIEVRSNGDFGLSVVATGIGRFLSITGFDLAIWGVPGDPSHDPQRLDMKTQEPVDPGPLPRIPFLSNPTSCGGPLPLRVEATSYQEPTKAVEATTTLPPISGCEEVEFAPSLRARPTTEVSDSPSGLDLDLAIPQNPDPDGNASAQLRDATLTLPEGLVVNPSAANGLEACSPEQAKLSSCPPASRIGSAELITPLLAEPLEGTLYVATPHRNPFGSLLALYLSVTERGLKITLPAEVEADPGTGRLMIKLRENPQLPVEHLRAHLFEGPLAPLRTPALCGTYATASKLTPWSTPASPPATPKDEYAIERAPDGGSCPHAEAALPSSPSFEAGSSAPIAGAFRPFIVNLGREDGTQQFGSLAVALPPGLTAKLAGTEICPDLALVLAAGRTGEAERTSPSCPAGSRVGQVVVAAGAGPSPFHAQGSVYLAGPYKGAPLSLAILTPAVAGPFDLGTVVVRNAVRIDSATAQVSAVSDPIPSILQGIPLDIRSVSLRLDKPQFTRTPTSCDPMAITGSLTSLLGQAASLADRFQVGDCPRLGFKPRLAIRFFGAPARNAHPAIRAVLRQGGHGANLAGATIALPPGQMLDLRHVGALCSSSLPPERCPPATRLGRAKVWSPLLDAPMRGSIYLRQPARRYPELLVALHGPYGLRVALHGSFEAASGRVSVRFSNLPDMPIGKAVLYMAGGLRGILVNSRSLCAEPRRGLVELVAQDNRRRILRPKPVVGAGC